jgi:diguanylate cyclase (GGDEF)-like protein
MLWGLLLFPAGRREVADRLRLGLDLAIVAIVGAAVVIYVVLGPTVLEASPDPLQTAFSIAHPVGDMVLLVGLGSVLLRGAAAPSARPLRLLAIGLIFYVAADLVYGYITLHSTYHGGDPVDSLWMIAISFFALAGAAQAAPAADDEADLESVRRRASWAPIIAVAVGFALLLISQRHDALVPDGSLLLTALLLAALVSARQFLAQKDLLRMQGRLNHQSLHDALTGLPNRVLVLDRAAQMLARAGRNQAPAAALYVDVDGFKHVNDSLGHGAGDQLLRIIAARLCDAVREADTVGRLAGDEFVVLLENVAFDAGPELVAERICEFLGQPTELDNSDRTFSVTVSLGFRS